MHIAFITPEYPHPKLNKAGGLGTSIKNLAVELIKEKHEVSVFVYSQNNDAIIMDNGIEIYKISHKKYAFLGWCLYRKYLQKTINKHIINNHIDILEAPDWTGVTAFMNFKCPLVIRLNGSDAYFCNLDNRKQKKKNFFFEKKALQNADKIVSVSAYTAKKTKDIFKLKHDIQVVHNGINTESFKPIDCDINKNQILYFGTIIRKKGVLELAHAFNLLVKIKPKASLILLGKDVIDVFENKSTLELFFNILSKEAASKVNHVNEVPYSEVAQIIAKANLVTLPSFAEAFPMTWLEAMAMEKALVTSNVGWANEMMIDGKTGFTVNPKEYVDYANKMKLLLEDDKLAEQCGKQARQVVKQKFEATIIANKNISLYKDLVN
ncbi:glycosyltransferase family 4 protein [Hwangdonia lutea]|uniref:Glycosyltransferase family 4 protein n=1 Tax=Hwangdonia lutea TaxID=3075823 RepID=A0AA97HRE9_9FLAO|nr:glycosyltransferase family 4 protein [Hwangdonia sp. SCSIO 19198]WOD43965.1 glycosyltransferase family 4 protein [Hwangdonia sp. SCSIO 19198]